MWLRLIVVEVRMRLHVRRWLWAAVFLGLYAFYRAFQAFQLHLGSEQTLTVWQIVAEIFMGPTPRPSVFAVMEWVSLPAAFILAMGEPFSLFSAPRERMMLVRMPNRLYYWTGKITAWLLAGFFFCLLAFSLAAVTTLVSFSQTNLWVLPSGIVLGDRFVLGPSLFVLAWVFLGVLAAVWYYTITMFVLSAAIKQPGMATVLTIFASCFITVAAGSFSPAIPFFGPAVGAVLAAQAFGQAIAGASFFAPGLILILWLVIGWVGGYRLFRDRLF
ncbi:MAG: hypothetical protein PWQ91_153 [Eubacteriales bacterium]|nr:hypothetical protein [Eubacteriales bacterium]